MAIWVYYPGSSQEMKEYFKREVSIQGTEHTDDARFEKTNWPVRHPRDHLEQEAISTLRPEGHREEMVQPKPWVTKGNWNHNMWGALHLPPSLSPHWLNPVEQLTQEPGQHSLRGPTHLRLGWGRVRSTPKSKPQDYPMGLRQLEASMCCKEMWTCSCGMQNWATVVCFLWNIRARQHPVLE